MRDPLQVDKSGDQKIIGLMNDDHRNADEEKLDAQRKQRAHVGHIGQAQFGAISFELAGKVIETDKQGNECKNGRRYRRKRTTQN